MPILELDDDVYQYLLRRALRIGEDGSSILRRELGLPTPGSGDPPQANGNAGSGNDHELVEFLATSAFVAQRTATDRYLSVLGHLAARRGADFEKVLKLGGRKRRYLGRTQEEVADSGTSMHPRQIPGSEFWAMTNADTAQKQDILGEVLGLLGYAKTVSSHAKAMIA